ncbi:MAG: tRNA (N6-isopentenyl adenosine(37)-C2)-methylthiotransferase MiaB [Vicinamibacterales bacterium]
MARKYLIETFGCQMNFHDGERISGLLEAGGYEATATEADADLIVLNTCSVREKAEDKLYSRLGELREATAHRSSPPTVAVTGCVAQQEGARLLKRSGAIDVVVGTQALKQLTQAVSTAETNHTKVVDVRPYDDVSFPLGVAKPSDPSRAWVTIIEGCNEFCSFCVVPYTRGHERMRPSSDILAEVTRAAESGRVEVQLLGQIVNHYQAPDDASCDFAGLLERVSLIPGIQRIRFASPHPRHATDRLIAAVRDLPKVCKHFHLPVQSGSNRILDAMRRRYTREEYLALVARLRAEIPDISISTDIIIGFPGETAGDFEDTMSLVREVGFTFIYSFKYSPRPNTLAIKRMSDDVLESEKTRRIIALQALQAASQLSFHQSQVGRLVEVLVESRSRRRESELSGRTRGWTSVNFPGPSEWIGRLMAVRITEAAPNSLRGQAEGL